MELIQAVSDYACGLALSYGGAMSGEHGDGWRSAYNPKLFGPELYAAMQAVKAAFDPDNLMNLGKIVDLACRKPALRPGLRHN